MSASNPPPPPTSPTTGGREPRRSTPLSLDPNQRAGEAVRRVLAHLLEVIRANVPGVLEDEDPEFLHQLRVTTRRARSALASLGAVLPKGQAKALARELRWLGSSSNLCRDLDVHLQALEPLQERLGKKEGRFEPALRLLRQARATAWEEAAATLRGERFRSLAESPIPRPGTNDVVPPDAERPVKAVVDEQILAAHDRFLRRANKLERKGTAKAAHRLRIAGKRLRYLLDLFRTLYPEEAVGALLGQLKRLQNVLGALQDVAVQTERLEGIQEQLEDHPTAHDAVARTILSLAQRRRELHVALAEPIAALQMSRPAYERLVAERPRKEDLPQTHRDTEGKNSS